MKTKITPTRHKLKSHPEISEMRVGESLVYPLFKKTAVYNASQYAESTGRVPGRKFVRRTDEPAGTYTVFCVKDEK